MLASPLSSTVAPARCAADARAIEPVGRHVGGREAEQAGQLALVRREHRGRRAAGEQRELDAEGVEGVGVDEHRHRFLDQLAHQRERLVGAAQAGAERDRLELAHLGAQRRRGSPRRGDRRPAPAR